MRGLILKRPVVVACILSLIFTAVIFVAIFHYNYTRQVARYSQTAAAAAEKINLALEKTQVIVQSVAWSNQMRSQDMVAMNWSIKRLHELYPILHTIYISNSEGKVLMATADKMQDNESIWIGDRSYFKAAQGGYTSITGPVIPRGYASDSLALIISSPYYLDNGDFGGVVAAAVNVDTLKQLVLPDKDDKSIIALMNANGIERPIFTIGGTLNRDEQLMVYKQMVSSEDGSQPLKYGNTISLAPLSTSTPLWVTASARPNVVRDMVISNLLLAFLAGGLLAIIFGLLLNWHQRRREHEQEREKQMAFVGEMAATIAHEIRNPLTYIKGKLSMHQEISGEDNDLLLEEVARIETIINDILLSAKPIFPEPEAVLITDVIKDAIRIMMALAAEKGINVQLINTDCDIIIKADRVQIRHLFINLIKNAIEAAPAETGCITITIKPTPSYVLVSVQDNGEGMSKKELKQLGKVFYTTKEGGTGLGITTCQRVVSAHKGKFEVISTKGVGTQISVFLPLVESPED